MARDRREHGRGGNHDPGTAPRGDGLIAALRHDEIQVRFLPTVDLRTGRVTGTEALVRWAHPAMELLQPGEFLPDAERSGYMRALTERVIELSTRAAGDWWRSGLALQLSVNLSPATFSEPDWELDEFVSRALVRTGLPASALRFEVSEDALTIDAVTARLGRLGALGASLSVDDFGTGRFSMRQLGRLRIAELKIDRSLVRRLAEEESGTIVRSSIRLAHQMGLQVVAEGVETEEAWRHLRSMGCERAQGFLIAKPMPAREVPAWLASWSPRARELGAAKRARRSAKAAEVKRAKAQAAPA